MLSADGITLLTDKEAILKRWVEHFQSALNRPSSINEDAIVSCYVLLYEFPTVMETRKAVQQLSSGTAPDADAIPAEVYKAGGGGATHGRETDRVVSLYVEEGGYPTRI